MNRWSALALLLAVLAAIALRVPKLDLRPLHNDEAVNATKVPQRDKAIEELRSLLA